MTAPRPLSATEAVAAGERALDRAAEAVARRRGFCLEGLWRHVALHPTGDLANELYAASAEMYEAMQRPDCHDSAPA